LAETFYGFSLREVRILGLRPEVRSTILLLLDGEGTKWEIRTITEDRLSLYHRSKQGPMHYQKRSAPATYGGVERLLSYISQHEEYERQTKKISRITEVKAAPDAGITKKILKKNNPSKKKNSASKKKRTG